MRVEKEGMKDESGLSEQFLIGMVAMNLKELKY